MPDWDCVTCTEEQQSLRGCNGGAQIPIRIAGDDLSHCPRRLIKDEPADFSRLLQLYTLYDKGVLATSGAVEDQPNAYVEAMAVVASAVAETQEFLQDEAAKGRGSPRDVKRKRRKS